ncbi:MAG: hypothetical protein IJF48_03710, partial [Clostridia bacterium]|nr:hypothetical protein [Clostridia bacterium]
MADNRSNINSIISDNLTLLSSEGSYVEQRRLAQLRERALFISRSDSLLDSDNRADEFDAIFSEDTEFDSIPETAAYVEQKKRAQLFSDKLTVCKFLAEIYR